MSHQSERFRQRARECRELAKTARDVFARQMLTETADDLEAEAVKIEVEEVKMNLPPQS